MCFFSSIFCIHGLVYTSASDPAISISLLCSSANEYISLSHSSQSHSFSKLSFCLSFIGHLAGLLDGFRFRRVNSVLPTQDHDMLLHVFSLVLPIHHLSHVTEFKYHAFVVQEGNRPYLPSIRVFRIHYTGISIKQTLYFPVETI